MHSRFSPTHRTMMAIVATLTVVATAMPPALGDPAVHDEPNYQTACRWWPEMKNVWTPIGWPNHLFRYCVCFEGTIIAEPHPVAPFVKDDVKPYAEQGMMVSFFPAADVPADPAARLTVPPLGSHNLIPGAVGRREPFPLQTPNGNRYGDQRWEAQSTPLLTTRWKQSTPLINGVVLEQQVFGYIPGASDVQTGVEPLYSWVRLRVSKVNPVVSPAGPCGFVLRINAASVHTAMFPDDNLIFTPTGNKSPWTPKSCAYPRELDSEQIGETGKSG